MASSSQDRQPLQLRPPALVGRTPASTRSTALKLTAVSLVIGLLLVSLDITPYALLEVGTDVGGMVSNLSKSLWRAVELMLGCALAGAAIVVPLWCLKRLRVGMVSKASAATTVTLPAASAKSRTATPAPTARTI